MSNIFSKRHGEIIIQMVSPLMRLSFVLQKFVRKLSCLFTVTRRIEELQEKRFLANIIRYALLLRYTSIQSYKLLFEDFLLPFLSLLSKISKGKIDAIKYAQALKKDGKISEDIYLLFDEMRLQKCEEYFGGKLIGSDENKEFIKELFAL